MTNKVVPFSPHRLQQTKDPVAEVCSTAVLSATLPPSQRKTGKREKNCEKAAFCQLVPIGELVRFSYLLTSDTRDLHPDQLDSYTRAEASLPLC